MTSITYPRHSAATGRPLGILDLIVRIGRTAFARRPSPPDHFADAAAVRRLADSQRTWSPSFAADLYAAADRHERLNER